MLAARELAWFGAGSGSRARELGVIWMGGLEWAGEGEFCVAVICVGVLEFGVAREFFVFEVGSLRLKRRFFCRDSGVLRG